MPITRRDAKKAKILYIEDNRENRMLVRAILEAECYTIVDAEDGLAGIEAAIREDRALILLDGNLPAIDGYDAVAVTTCLASLASRPATRHRAAPQLRGGGDTPHTIPGPADPAVSGGAATRRRAGPRAHEGGGRRRPASAGRAGRA